jgi:glutamyl-tRNA synthetase
MKRGFHILREVDEMTRFFLIPDEQIVYAPEAVEKVLKKQDGQGLTALREVRGVLAGVGQWTTAELETAVNKFCEQKQLALGKVAQPMRVAISGGTVSPPIFESLEFLGRDRTLARIDRCVAGVS